MKRRIYFLSLSIVMLSLLMSASSQYPSDAPRPVEEPNLKTSRFWWPDQMNVWTPVGWKDHSFRFDVLYNGAIIADPVAGTLPHENSSSGEDFMLTFHINHNGKSIQFPDQRMSLWKKDGGGIGIQGWNDNHDTPVLWTEFRLPEGLVIRSEVFAHMDGSKDTRTALEPLYAWVRLSVVHVDNYRHAMSATVTIEMSRCYLDHFNHREYASAVDINPDRVSYPKELHPEIFVENGQEGVRILEPDGKVRLAAMPSDPGRFRFSRTENGICALTTILKARVGDCVELLMPMLPVEPLISDREQELGYDGSLTLSDWYWSQKPATAARFDVPESDINKAIGRSVQLASVLARKDSQTGDYTYLTGSWGCNRLWTTPTSMISHMFIDQLGYFDMTRKYSEGFLSNPEVINSTGEQSDHGAILHQVCTHALLSDDKAFIGRWTEPVVRACEFLRDAHPQRLHDIAWNYKGVCTAARLLRKIDHPRAEEFANFADDFKATFQKAYRELTENGERWVDDRGRSRYKPPVTMLSGQLPACEYSDASYLDKGPMMLVWAGLMDADDPIMRDMVDFFREGPNNKLRSAMPYAGDRPVLVHEMSGSKPYCSWNLFHSWQLNDRQHFLEGMYSLFSGALSRNTYISCKHRHGMHGNLLATPLAVYAAKLSVIDDQIAPGELHLMRICPLAWISSAKETLFESMPTEFGPVTLRFRKSANGKELNVSFFGVWRNEPSRIVLHIPPIAGLQSVRINGEKHPLQIEYVL